MYHIRHAYEHGMQQLNRCFDMAPESGHKAKDVLRAAD